MSCEEFHLTKKECFVISKFLEKGTNIVSRTVTDTGKTSRLYVNGNLIATFGEAWQGFSKALSVDAIKTLYDLEEEEVNFRDAI